MKTARIFLAGMYLHLLFSVLVFLGILVYAANGWNKSSVLILILYLLAIGFVQITGWIYVGAALKAYGAGEIEKLKKGWKILKLGSIPFYILNFLYSLFVWFLLVGASRGLFFLLVPIPVFITSIMILQSGIAGVCYVKYLRDNAQEKPSSFHFVFQLLSVLDIISTILLLKKYGK